jgi:hypothetical protein
MKLLETHIIHSVERLLLPSEISQILAEVGRVLEGRRAEFDVATRDKSVHSIDGVAVAEVKAAYEPRGRIECDELPESVELILNGAVERRLADIRVNYPSVSRGMDWFYIEYTAGQHVTPHADYYHNEDNPAQPKLVGLSVLLSEADEGGEFFIETAGSAQLWDDDGMLRPGVDSYSEWFRELPRSRWRVAVSAGDALCFGTQVIHGTEPVLSGRAIKMIGFLA